MLIQENFEPGDVLIVQFKINLDRDDGFVVYDKQMALDMMFHIKSQQKKINDVSVLNEMKKLGETHHDFDQIQQLFNQTQNESIDFLKAVIKAYTSEAVFRQIGNSMVNGNFYQIQCYLASVIHLQQKFGKNLQYSQINKPLYRGVNPKNINLNNYRINQIHFWPGFSSASKNQNFAIQRSRGVNQVKQGLIFEIYVNNLNDPPTNIELPKSWSFYPSEEEVLLLPFFCFQVLNIYDDIVNNIKRIKIIEIPYQNFLSIKNEIYYSRVIWIDSNIDNKENDGYKQLMSQEFNEIGFCWSKNIDQVVSQINQTVKTVLITSGQIGKILLPKIQHLENVMVVLVFCFNTEEHQKWASNFQKVKGVTNQFKEALKIAKNQLQNVLKNQN